MNFVDAVKSCLSKYAVFEGRARRSEYWFFYLFNIIVGCLTLLMPFVCWLVSVALLLPSLAVTVRRLHDVGKSGWFLLLAFIPIANLYLIVLYFLDSVPDNEYGPNPKQ